MSWAAKTKKKKRRCYVYSMLHFLEIFTTRKTTNATMTNVISATRKANTEELPIPQPPATKQVETVPEIKVENLF